MEFKNLLTDEEHAALKSICQIIPAIKSKYFSLGRDMDKLVKLLAQFGDKNDKS